MTPGDLTITQIAAVFDALTRIQALALEGADEREIAEVLEWRLADVREGARLRGFSVSPMVRRQHLCPRCGHLLMPDGSCAICPLNRRLERLYAVNEEERRRLVEQLSNEIDSVKQDTCRVRRELGTNPRRGAQG